MGIPEAEKVYEGTYGVKNNRVIKEEEETSDFLKENTGPAVVADFSLDLVDLPTFNIAALMSLGREIATKISSSFVHGSSKNLGQLILFYNKKTNQIIDTLHDENNVLSDDDTAGKNRFMYSATFGLSTSLVKEFYEKLENIDRRIVGIKRVQVNIPSSQEEINRLLDPPIEKMMMSSESYKMMDFDSINQWLSKHDNLKPRQFITSTHIITNNSPSSSFSWKETTRIYREAFYASELEGFILLYAHRMLKVLKRVLKSSTNKRGRYALLFVDGKAPAIKKMTRFKRQKRREWIDIRKKKKLAESTPDKKSDAATNMLFHSCERLAVRVPSNIMMCALLDIFRIPLVRTIGANSLYLSLSSFSEAEDDIVRMISCLLDLETPTKHFYLSEKKGLVEYKNGDKKKSKWGEIISTVKQHTNVEHRKVSVNLFSHDSDVLAKWNLMAAHHNQVCKLLRISSRDAALSLESCRFFRSKNGPPPDKNSLGGLAFRRRPVAKIIYDLSESPVLLTPESTLLIMLTKGSDYNTSLVSDSTYDVQIRSEVAMFESLTCTCISGWPMFFETVTHNNTTSRENCGNVSRKNMSRNPCSVCGKYLVMPFWSTKLFFAAQAIDFIGHPKHLYQPPTELNSEINKHDIHRALAINAASNVMAYLTMGSFNQRIFGNITCMSKIITSFSDGNKLAEEKSTLEFTLENIAWNKKRKSNDNTDIAKPNKKKVTAVVTMPVSKDLSLAVYNSRREFFNNHTEGGIPLLAEDLRSHKEQLFGKIFPLVEENVPSHKEDCIDLMDYETLFGKEESEDDESDWMLKAKQAFTSPNNKILSTALKTTNNVSRSTSPPPSSPPQSIPWDSLVQEFDKCLSRCSLKCVDGSILSKMSGLLLTNSEDQSIKGVDDDRITGVPYSIKTMNLLIIVYMNICGLEDQRIVNGQLTPLIHEEYCSKEMECNTDRTNFTAAVLESTLLHYKPEIDSGSKIKQAKRQNWTKVTKRLGEMEKRTFICTDNCKRLINDLPIPKESVWIPGKDLFMPVLGLAVSKPWTPLALWSSFLYYYQQQHARNSCSRLL